MAIIAFVPVRGGSKSIPLKNIKPFCGKPLLYWNLLELEKTDEIDTIIIATDSDIIESTVLSFNFKKCIIFRRNSINATDTASSESVILEFLNYQKNINVDDYLILVQVTSPLTISTHFKEAILKLHETKSDSLLSCIRLKRFFWSEDGLPLNYEITNRPRRQDFEGVMTENGAFYINKISNILKDNCRLSGKICIYEMPDYTFVEIDEEHDWLLAETLMRKYYFVQKKIENQIKLLATDIDGVLTDSGMYYSENGDELKKFNTRDGKGLELLRNAGIKTAFITSENTKIVEKRAKKLNIDYTFQGISNDGKLNAIKEICMKENITLNNVAYIGDDINCLNALMNVGWAACPFDAVEQVKAINNIDILSSKGGEGVLREFAEKILKVNESFS